MESHSYWSSITESHYCDHCKRLNTSRRYQFSWTRRRGMHTPQQFYRGPEVRLQPAWRGTMTPSVLGRVIARTAGYKTYKVGNNDHEYPHLPAAVVAAL